MSWKTSGEYWRRMPPRSSAIFGGAVFCLFSSLGFISSGSETGHPYPIANFTFAIFNGACAVVWAIAGTRRLLKTMVTLGLVQFATNFTLGYLFNRMEGAWSSASLNPKLYGSLRAYLATYLVIAGYGLFLTFLRFEGNRYFSAMTEVRLSGEIHRSLVPEIQSAQGSFEFYGRSWPSGEVGGDLVDLVNAEWGWIAYVADVSGHGVPAGILMTMTKSAVRTRLLAAGPTGLLAALNDALMPLSEPNMYVTFAFLSLCGEVLEYATAGHTPMLHYRHRSAQVEELSITNLPVAMLDRAEFDVARIALEPGDVLVILTDGFTEIEDKGGRELGFEPLKSVLLRDAGAPLAQLAGTLRDTALAHGKQLDDQTLLLVRHRNQL